MFLYAIGYLSHFYSKHEPSMKICEGFQSFIRLFILWNKVNIFQHSNIFSNTALKCPSGSKYDPCGTACPQPSCQNPAGSGSECDKPCVEGCFCDSGLVLSGDKCVPVDECGCTDEDGNYRPVSVQGGDLF